MVDKRRECGGASVAVALGSNLQSAFGDRAATLREAARRVGGLGWGASLSSFYDTAPVGYTEQPRFLNAAMTLETELGPAELMRALLEIERGMGRSRTGIPAKGPRVIDLDLLLYRDATGADVLAETVELTLPHPAMAERRFVLEPLAEVAGSWVHPVEQVTVGEMLRRLLAVR